MKRAEVEVGGRYRAMVSGRLCVVRILQDKGYRGGDRGVHAGWDALNERTGHQIWVKSAQRLRPLVPDYPLDENRKAALLADIKQSPNPLRPGARVRLLVDASDLRAKGLSPGAQGEVASFPPGQSIPRVLVRFDGVSPPISLLREQVEEMQ